VAIHTLGWDYAAFTADKHNEFKNADHIAMETVEGRASQNTIQSNAWLVKAWLVPGNDQPPRV
jgi:hypothetical protein